MPRHFKAHTQQVKKASILKCKPGWFKIVSPYHHDFVEALKTVIPPSMRVWNGGDKSWEVRDSYLTDIISLLQAFFDEVEQDLTTPTDPNGTYPELFLLATAPDELVKAAYKCLAVLYHPDRGGDPIKMSALNVCYDKIKRERGIK